MTSLRMQRVPSLEIEIKDDTDAISEDSKCNKCQCDKCIKITAYIWKIISFFLSYMIIWSIISEILVLRIYYHSDEIFFILSLGFLILPLLAVSCCACPYTNCFADKAPCRWYLCFPIINIPILNSLISLGKIEDEENGRMTVNFGNIFLTGFMTFPLYIINLSYLLENVNSYQDIPIPNLIQLVSSFVAIIINPIMSLVNASYADTVSKKIKAFLHGLFAFGPVGCIEMIHFFPVLFCYYMDKSIDYDQLSTVLIIFNVPKLLFFLHFWCISYSTGSYDSLGSCLFGALAYVILFGVIPLIPYQFTMMGYRGHDDMWITSKKIMSLIMMLYLLAAYVGSSVYIIWIVGWMAMSVIVRISFIVVFCLVLIIIITLPCVREIETFDQAFD